MARFGSVVSRVTVLALAIFSMFVMTPSGAVADGWTAPGKVTYINTWQNGFAFSLSVHNNCSAQQDQYFVSWQDNPAAKQIYAVVLTAFETGTASSGAQNQVAVNYVCGGALPGGAPSGAAAVSGVDVR